MNSPTLVASSVSFCLDVNGVAATPAH
jgi:hypothetical protein